MKTLMAANWKMYKNKEEASATLADLALRLTALPQNREVVVFAPFTALSACSSALADNSHIALGGQNCYPAAEGAFTGEISPTMLLNCGCAWVLAGHSERRSLIGETDVFVGKKTAYALNAGLNVVLCIGETSGERDSGKLTDVLVRQLEAGLADISTDIAAERIALAYEPVWAIGTGRVAGPTEIAESHAVVRNFLKKRLPRQSQDIRILYGGSVKPENTKEIMTLDNVNGVLVGGASLQAESFSRIVLA
ncbi:MAG: triose-phosphate isomerase [Desulfovibrio sp.]|jgi:triosephosphate isomerase|nr:triose-phosphate isomerase [Desulfovibrio sp.]